MTWLAQSTRSFARVCKAQKSNSLAKRALLPIGQNPLHFLEFRGASARFRLQTVADGAEKSVRKGFVRSGETT